MFDNEKLNKKEVFDLMKECIEIVDGCVPTHTPDTLLRETLCDQNAHLMEIRDKLNVFMLKNSCDRSASW